MPTKSKGKVALVQIAPTETRPPILMVEVTLDDQILTIDDKPEQNIAINDEIRKLAQKLIDRVVQEAQS